MPYLIMYNNTPFILQCLTKSYNEVFIDPIVYSVAGVLSRGSRYYNLDTRRVVKLPGERLYKGALCKWYIAAKKDGERTDSSSLTFNLVSSLTG